ncbi:MAG: hypothetical protein AAGG02_09065 [Cyanobacteria bacterium P01_H01_bin.15]
MFLQELQPFTKELLSQPLAFLGGFCSGVFKLDPNDDPLRGWLSKQGVATTSSDSTADLTDNGNGPQSITIE